MTKKSGAKPAMVMGPSTGMKELTALVIAKDLPKRYVLIAMEQERNLNMPCRSDYMAPTPQEQALQNTAQLAVWAAEQAGVEYPKELDSQTDNIYAQDVGQTEFLCALISGFDRDTFDRVCGNAKSISSIKLALWWIIHQEADEKRAQEEADEVNQKTLIVSASEKLTDAEWEALGLRMEKP